MFTGTKGNYGPKDFQLKSIFLVEIMDLKFPIDDNTAKWGFPMVSICWYCVPPLQETTIHLFLIGQLENYILRVYTRAAGILGHFI